MLRYDLQIVADLIDDNSKVIDIGCGDGVLVEFLEKEKNVKAHGIEVESKRVSRAVGKGLSIIQGNADDDLQYYGDKSFDYAILGQTLQVMSKPKDVLEEALRIADKVILVIPNFGYISNRTFFYLKGMMPVTKQLSYEWYETPNIHFCTIKDMVNLAKEVDSKIEERFYINKSQKLKKFKGDGAFYANMFGKLGVFVLSQKAGNLKPEVRS